MWLRLFAVLFGWELVWLRDFQNEVYLTKVNYGPWGKWAYVYPFLKIGNVSLNDDGTCGGKSSYVEKWKWARQKAVEAGNSTPNRPSTKAAME
jgi:hypothetical protein